ncbi:unnamed protein product [Rotaria sp. Silwood1]|nr:unnamed protein product [Rotaria sp. Silwood1]CAF1649778.1 unnamed protein product [Rotaria sp. Silwood1]CAF3795474.1 unnamed protein product [Rotaria sp. Silwood1]CAF3856593.1 unnamed protein product [Rotaria sp. Silwood1]CAF4849982.1 unnamed protein product [Rotaria sp. Silwood1]
MEYDRNTGLDEKEEITMMELKASIGLLLLAGLLGRSKGNLRSLWRTSPLESPIFKATISKSRFDKIMSCLRFDDKRTREERKQADKFAAIREIWSDFQDKLKTCYTPGLDLTIDEQLLGYREKCPFRQFILKKPDKYGLKFWLCVDAESYYVLNAFPYIGRQPGQEKQQHIGESVVLELLKPFYDSNRNVAIDNFFTSVPLAKNLQTKNLTLIGTLRKNKSEIPMEFLPNKTHEVGSLLFGFEDNLTLVSFVPKKNKAVLLLSSKHHDNQVDNKTGKPIVVLNYNKTKGAVDTVDQICHKYTVKRGTKRWPLCIFYGMIDVTALNAFILWKAKNPEWNRDKRYQRRLFLEELGLSLVTPLLDFRSKTSKFLHKDIQNALAIVGHPVAKRNSQKSNEDSAQGKRKRCSMRETSKDRKTSIKCCISIGKTFCSITSFLSGNRMTYCTRCWCLGHMRNKCKVEHPRCRICLNSINDHQTHVCSNIARCPQCNGNHHSLSSVCEKVLQYRSQLKEQVNNDLSTDKLHRLIPQEHSQPTQFQLNKNEFLPLPAQIQGSTPWKLTTAQPLITANMKENEDTTRMLLTINQNVLDMKE